MNTVLAPLLGVTLESERWDLGSGISLVRGDLCPAPPQAVWGSGRQDDDPNVLAMLTVESRPTQPPPLTEARMAFRKLVTALRLLKPGGAALSSVAWWRTDDGPWQEVSARHVRPLARGPYLLEPSERGELAELFELARSRPALGGALPLGPGTLRARVRAARGARRAVRPSAFDAGAAGPRRPLARGPCSSPRGPLRGAGPSPGYRELRRAGVQAGAAGDARQCRLCLPRVDRGRVGRCRGARAGGEPAGAAPRPRMRAPRTGPGRDR